MKTCLANAVSVGLLIAFCHTQPLHGQFKLDIGKVADAAFPNEEPIDEAPAEAVAVRRIRIPDIERLIFNRHRTRAAAKTAAEQQLKLAMERIDEATTLTDEQRQKLLLAGNGDIARLFLEIDQIQSQFKLQKNPQDLNNLMQRVQPFRQKFEFGLFGRKSLFQRTANHLMDSTQLEKLKEQERQRLRFHFDAALKQAVAKAERQAPLRKTQREAILQLTDGLAPPVAYDRRYLPAFALYGLSKLEPQLRALLSERQLASFQRTFQQGRRMEQILKQQGMLE